MSKKPLIELLKNMGDGVERRESLEKPLSMLDHDFSLYHIQEVTFDEDSPRKEAFENVLNSLSVDGIIFTYLLLGDGKKVHFLFGIAKDKRYQEGLLLDVDEIGETILKPSLEGNFRGSVVERLDKSERRAVKGIIDTFSHVAKLDGVPSVHEENEQFQGIDRLVDIMSGDKFCLAVLADPLSLLEINKIEAELYKIYDKLLPLSKKSIQSGDSHSKTTGTTEGSTTTKTTGTNDGLSITTNTGKSVAITSGTSDSGNGKQTSKSSQETDHNKHKSGSEANTKGTSTSDSVANNVGSNFSKQTGSSSSESREFSDKAVQEWLTYIDEVLLKRVQVGKNKGLYLSNIYLLSDSIASVLKLGNTARSIFSGEETNKSPLTFKKVTNQNEVMAIKNFQFPALKPNQSNKTVTEDSEKQLALLLSKNPFNKYSCNWLSTNELSVVAGLPQKEVVGLTLKEEVEFGLNVNSALENSNKLYLGNLVKSGLNQNIDVHIDKRDLDKHTFIAGVTGSGKTTTCHRLLESAQMPFLVIEPAKTEYRVLTKKNKDILIFTLGNDNVAPFRLNPFEFFPHENITSRVDMIKASIESAFDMEAAIPQLIEAAIYRCYEDKGWNIATSKNSQYEDPFAAGVYAFPTLSDLVRMTEVVVAEQGFDDRLKQDYIGSIKARLQGLLIGSKGQMLDTPRSINFKDLAQRSVILELEEIRNPSEKSLVMGFVLANLNEAIKANYEEYRKRGEKFRHITLIEEAHRLLSKFEPGDSQNKKQGVETFADMLAEVRKYGESLIIVDQIPNKLTPEVLKNTNTKIIHKLFAKDDKEAVGNTMALSDEQKDFLSNLEPGRVILSSSGMSKPLQVQIKELVSTTNESDVEPSKISELAFEYYAENYQSGLIQGLELFSKKPSANLVFNLLQGTVKESWYEVACKKNANAKFLSYLGEFGHEFMVNYINKYCYKESTVHDNNTRKSKLATFLSDLEKDSQVCIDMFTQAIFQANIKVMG
ncbi:ATP-binding protein [Vibrio sp. CAU 1672]|uniref:ATP-binding protein n=1 Tax=Vibrio sp. CAU 1672 TaxID=3032594 RepID=UPI0023DC0E6F|nr:ATP-binding protein [Vibrio sp. CAU 1672]MDF2154514.1 ATP-binding protein [Vibrio sp. CAU 1672]